MKLVLASLLGALVLAGCNQSSQPQFEMPKAPIDVSTAQTMLMRSLQAEEAGDVEAEKADLFPRESHVLGPCAKLRVSNGHLGSIAMRDENGNVPKITGVTVSGLTPGPAGNIFTAGYTATGNAAYSGSESFIWANGRWWIRCNV